MNEIIAVDYVKIASGKITSYRYLEGYYRGKNKTSFTSENNTKGKIKGKLSPGAKKRIKKIITVWLSSVQFYLMSKNYSLKETGKYIKFITLTLSAPQAHTDKDIKQKMLNQFLTKLKRKYGLKNYLWIAETQGNGNIHFHIITNTNIHHKLIRDTWNKIQNNYGYIDRFEKKFKHRNPNSTDIHVLKKIRNLNAYLTKEATKGQQNRLIDGKLWGCNKELMQITEYETVYSPQVDNVLFNLKQKKDLQVFEDNFFAVYFYESLDIFEFLKFRELPDMYAHYEEMMKILFFNNKTKTLEL